MQKYFQKLIDSFFTPAEQQGLKNSQKPNFLLIHLINLSQFPGQINLLKLARKLTDNLREQGPGVNKYLSKR